MRAACRAVDVPWETARRWQSDNRDGFFDRVKEAYELKVEGWIDELDSLASQELGSGSMAAVQARRTQIDVRKWIASRMMPHRWGDRVAHDHQVSGSVVIYLPSNGRMYEPVLEGTVTEQIEGPEDG
jgi:hypothetical protein